MSCLQEILNIEQLAAFLSVPKATVYKLARDGKVPGHKVGRHWRFSRQAIRWWMEDSSPHANDRIQPGSPDLGGQKHGNL